MGVISDQGKDRKLDGAPHVALFVTCLVDLFRPRVGFAAIELLERAGCRVSVPSGQTCCGQPAFNAGDRRSAERVLRPLVKALGPYDYVVAPSGSCAGMLRHHLPELFEAEPALRVRACAVAAKVHELTGFLIDVMGSKAIDANLPLRATYHDSCSGLRQLGVRAQPRELLGSVRGLALVEMAEAQTCCGFGGLFCVKYPAISTRMVDDKLRCAAETGADLLLAGDMGCLMNMAGRLRRVGSRLRVHHVAEVLAGGALGPGVGHPSPSTA